MEHSDTGNLWESRFGKTDEHFHASVQQLTELPFSRADLIHQFPLFTGHVNLARYLSLYEAYKLVADKVGHLADVGSWLGSSFLFTAKLVRLFEPYASSRVHAFDWFEGMDPVQGDKDQNYRGSYDSLRRLIEIQDLSDVAAVHKLDLRSELAAFGRLPEYAELRFKYVFMDCGLKEVLASAIPFFWERLLPGGVMLFDHFSTHIQHESTLAQAALPPGTVFRTFPFTRQPTAYVIK